MQATGGELSEQWLVLYSVPKLPKCKIFEGRKVVDELDIFNKLKIGIASDEKIREWSKRRS